MKSIAEPAVIEELVRRLEGLTPSTPRRWGTLSPHEMLCHLADATDSVLGGPGRAAARSWPWRRWLALYTPIPWPHGLRTPAHVDPRKGGSRPALFAQDRERVLAGLRALAAAPETALPASHGHFGAMRAQDWRRWAYRHTDHHLRQFGL